MSEQIAYQRQPLTEAEIRVIQHLARRLCAQPRLYTLAQLILILQENHYLTGEVNHHRKARGLEPLKTYNLLEAKK